MPTSSSSGARDRPAFYVRREPKADKVIKFGTSSDQPLLGDWDGDGRANPGVRNPGSKTFQLKAGRKVAEIRFGGRTDLAVAGDWDGDGRWEVGTRRATSQPVPAPRRRRHASPRSASATPTTCR